MPSLRRYFTRARGYPLQRATFLHEIPLKPGDQRIKQELGLVDQAYLDVGHDHRRRVSTNPGTSRK